MEQSRSKSIGHLKYILCYTSIIWIPQTLYELFQRYFVTNNNNKNIFVIAFGY